MTSKFKFTSFALKAKLVVATYCTLIHYIALSELLIPVMNVCAKHGNALNAANKMPAPNISIMSFVSN